MPTKEMRGLVILAAVMAGCYFLMLAVNELIQQSQRAEVAIIRADLAAWQVSQLMEEARDITLRAAKERGLHD